MTPRAARKQSAAMPMREAASGALLSSAVFGRAGVAVLAFGVAFGVGVVLVLPGFAGSVLGFVGSVLGFVGSVLGFVGSVPGCLRYWSAGTSFPSMVMPEKCAKVVPSSSVRLRQTTI